MARPASPSKLRKGVILGSGAAAWMTAAALRRAAPQEALGIVVVEPDRFDHGVGLGGAVEASLPPFCAFLRRLGIHDAALVQHAQGSFSLGTLFRGWSREGDWCLPFGDLGAAIGPVAFDQLVRRLRAQGSEVPLEQAALAAVLARAGRFAHPSRDPRSPMSSLSYGLHLSLGGLTRILKQAAPAVEVAAAPFRSAERGADGRVSALLLSDGTRIDGDLFIDCSGPQALLATGSFESWSQWFFCDRLTVSSEAAAEEPALCQTNEANETGWTCTVPVRGGVQRIRTYSSVFGGDTEGAIAFHPGMQAAPWTANVVAIGSSAVCLEPIARSGLHLVQTGIERLLRLLPVGDGRVEASEYNRLAREEAERLRDFSLLPFLLNGRVGQPFWDRCRAMDVPDGLARKIEQYRSRGRVPLEDGETFERDAWIFMFDGLGVQPRRYDPLADGLTAAQISSHVGRIREIFARTAAGLPTHGDYLQKMLVQ